MSNSYTVTNAFGQTFMVSNVANINEAYKVADMGGMHGKPALNITPNLILGFDRSGEDFKRDYLNAKEKLKNEKPVSGNDILRHEGYRALVNYVETHRKDIIASFKK
jgi:hypothetical protein